MSQSPGGRSGRTDAGRDADGETIEPSFFRDGAAFESLKQHVFPAIMRRKRRGGAVRIWSVGCATGEEPYSILIALFEYLAQRGISDLPIQLFGTDVSETCIEKAREGVFLDAAVQDMNAERLAHFFTPVAGGGYRISKSVRERCAFAVQDIATAAPFSKIDLVCCRNVLGTFGHELQRRVLSKLAHALDESGFLMLGRGENIADGANPLVVVDEENRIFAPTARTNRMAAAPYLVRRTESPLLPPDAPGGVKLEEELRATKEYLQRTIDAHQRATEELLSANEELASSNEELQSLNAKVQAAKEEIQSTNDELSTLNEELHGRNTELKSVNGDLLNVIAGVERALGAAEWARDHANATIEAVQVPFVVLTEKLAIASTNRAFKERYGASRAPLEAEGVVQGLLDNPALRPALEGVSLRDQSFEGLELDCELPGLGKRCVSLSARSVPMPEAGRLILLAIEDVTGRRRDEAERARLLRETQAAKASAEDANRTKDLFLATLSHELRTPLSTLLLSAELLRMGSLDEDKFRRTIDSIARATKVQAQLIDDLFDISRIVTGKLTMELQAVSLAACVEAAVDALAPTAQAKRVRLEVRVDSWLPPVPGDPIRLQQVASNLLANAIKFTPDGGQVQLIVEADGERAQLAVIDSGVGIDADFLPSLFDRFSQEHYGETRAHGGLGLGLAIVRHIVDAHGGSVRAGSAGKGRGSTFTVSLPLMKWSEAHRQLPGDEASVGQTTGSVRGFRILVVDDDPGARSALAEMLGLIGADVRSAASAADALDLFRAFGPDVLVSDISMPEESGYSLIRRIRALDRDSGGHVPAVAMTALAAAEDRRHALEAGFDAHVAKPVAIDGLLAVLTPLCELARQVPGGRQRSTRAAFSK